MNNEIDWEFPVSRIMVSASAGNRTIPHIYKSGGRWYYVTAFKHNGTIDNMLNKKAAFYCYLKNIRGE